MQKNILKICYCGLSNAGKTSIILSLEREYAELSRITPTLGIDRTTIDLLKSDVLSLWDMGGQEKFREKYIDEVRSFLDTDLIFYVVDIRDDEQYDASLTYYKEILKVLKESNEDPEIIVCFHKFDPNIENKLHYIKNVENLQKLFEENTKKELKFFKTSIYNKKSLIESFSSGISTLIPDLNNIDLILNLFIIETEIEGILFFEKNSLILSEAYKKEKDKSLFLTIITDMLTTLENIKELQRVNEIDLILNRQLHFLLKNVIIDKTDFFTAIVARDKDIQEIWNKFLKNEFPKIEKILLERK
jgi:small GTP-binding protein